MAAAVEFAPRENVPTFSLEHYRARVKEMNVEELHGHLAQFHENKRAGTLPPNLEVALREADVERAGEVRAHVHDAAHGPKLAWESNAQKRRLEQEQDDNAVVEMQKTGKGGVQRYVVPRKNIEEAAQCADGALVQ